MDIQASELLAPMHAHYRMELIRAVRHHEGDWATLRVTKPPKNAKRQGEVVIRLNYRTNETEERLGHSRMAWFVASHVHTFGRTPEEAEAAIVERVDLIRRFLEANGMLLTIERRDR